MSEGANGTVNGTVNGTISDEVFERQGRVKFFDTRKGFGFIRADDGSQDVFLGINTLRKSNAPTSQLEDKRCRYVPAEGDKGPYAKSFALL